MPHEVGIYRSACLAGGSRALSDKGYKGGWDLLNGKIMRIFLLVSLFSFISPVWAGCALSDISINSVKLKFVDACRSSPCIQSRGVAVLNNRCAAPVAVKVKITGYDKEGLPTSTYDFWVNSGNNVPPGNYPFSLDYKLSFDPDMKRYDVIAVDIKQ